MAVLKWTRRRPKTSTNRFWGAKLGKLTVGSIQEAHPLGSREFKSVFEVTIWLPNVKKGEHEHQNKTVAKPTLSAARSYGEQMAKKWMDETGLEKVQEM